MKTNFYWAGIEYHWIEGVGFEIKESSLASRSGNWSSKYLNSYWRNHKK